MKLVDVTVAANCTPFLKMRYPETPTSSTDAVQVRLMAPDVAEAVRPPGTVGACVSPVGGRVIVTAALSGADTLPAASFAQAKRVTGPGALATKLVGAVAFQRVSAAAGATLLSITI
ncbi:MAG: hypothetical protein M0C28_05085 [Candidatus Moduliflexus flocculans]|nr:hypothetical protein [Candidatus Moduliflexus flocculans]